MSHRKPGPPFRHREPCLIEELPAMSRIKNVCLWVGSVWILAQSAPHANGADGGGKPAQAGDQVSYYKQVRPIFQAQCLGCHQPAKSRCGLVMTNLARLL